MRQIGNLPDESSALTFSDYLYAKGIENEVEAARDGSWKVWIHADNKIEESELYLEKYQKNSDDPEYTETARQADIKRQQKRKAEEEFQRKIFDRDRIFAWHNQIALLSGSLIAISVAVYVYGMFDPKEFLIQLLSIAPYNEYLHQEEMLTTVFKGEIWRLITPIFIHFSPLHLLFNMWWLKDLGTAIEKRMSPLFLLSLVLALALPSNVAQYFVSRSPSFGGMSGVVYGLFGYIWMQSKFNPLSGFYLDKQVITMMVVWFFLCLSGLVGPIANTAHAVGLAVGMGIGYASAFISNRR